MYRCAALLSLLALPLTSIAEEDFSGWRLNLDNDLLTGLSTDRDYTGGIGVTLSGGEVQHYLFGVDWLRQSLDEVAGFANLSRSDSGQSFHSQQYGMMLFTPDDISSSSPVYDDRPYASLFFISTTSLNVLARRYKAFYSTLTIGLLGLELAEQVQSGLHEITDSDVPNGWDNQVSAGGEPTLMLTYGVQQALHSNQNQQLKLIYEGNAGTITDINVGVDWRWGRLQSPWWMHNRYQSKYLQQPTPVIVDGSSVDEFYLWAGARLNARLYNALLQGQFRHSEVTVSREDMNWLVAEYWLGVTRQFARHFHVSLFFRGHSEEFKGLNARSAAWAGLELGVTY